MIKLKSLIEARLSNIFSQHILNRGDVGNLPPKLYHATFEPLVNKIMSLGLVPGGTSFGSPTQNFIESDKRFVYLGSDPNKCRELLHDLLDAKTLLKDKDIKINVLTINTTVLDKKKFSVDPAATLLGMRSYMYQGTIPPSAIIDYGD